MIDLHIHTTASADGQHTPKEIVTMAAGLGLSAIAFADHNTVAAVNEGASLCRNFGIDFISAVELNTDYCGRDLHLLGYGMDVDDPALEQWLESIRGRRWNRAQAWAEKLASLGLTIDYAQVKGFTPGQVPTGSSFLRALLLHRENFAHPLVAPYAPGGPKADNPYVLFYFEVLVDGPARVDVKDLTTIEAIDDLRNRFSAVPILAHPGAIADYDIDVLVDAGLAGLEAISSYHDAATTARHLEYCRNRDLLVTAGSDFHGVKFKKAVALGGIEGNRRQYFDDLIARL